MSNDRKASVMISCPDSAPGGANFTIARANSRSFEVSSVAALNAILIVYGFYPVPMTNSTEFARLGRGENAGKPAELVIVYHSGTATCAGAGWERAAQLLD